MPPSMPRLSHDARVSPEPSSASMRVYSRFDDPALHRLAGTRGRLDENLARFFSSDSITDRFARALAERRIVPLKELLESAEFFERARRRMRASAVADLCCGHGLVGVLFALLERRVERVVLVDRRRPASFDAVLEAATAVGPWVAAKVEYVEGPLKHAAARIPSSASLVAVHACGARTDRCLNLAIERRVPIAVMPCCYRRTADVAPRAIREALGAPMATDVDRTYRLRAAGFQVSWSDIPACITHHHRILVALPSRPSER